MSTAILMTDEELMELPKNGHKYEYIDGELIMSPARMPHERIGFRLGYLIERYLEKNPIAEVYSSGTGFRMASGNLLSPDLSIVLIERFPGGKEPEGFGEFAPDIAAEIISPTERPNKLAGKIDEYFDNGSQIVLVVNQNAKVITVYRSSISSVILSEMDMLDLSPVLPGFSCRVSEIFKKRSK